ncbi:hypothetical protein KY284_014109 [Solanum tuberosum]|nr:hypothetical protein KY284_014109 [Solanum tuberosum]
MKELFSVMEKVSTIGTFLLTKLDTNCQVEYCVGRHIKDGSNGDVAVDHYNRYLEDIKLMEDLGVNSYRFSISWARILPKGTFGDVNMAGIEHYNKLIDALLQKGIQPFITLTHYDIPQELEERYGGWLSSQIHNSSEDIAATERARSFYVNWFLDPIILGRYPKEMVQILGSNLPDFSKNDLGKLSYGLDFIGINYYTAKYIKDCLFSACEHGNTWSEGSYLATTEKDGVYIGQPTGAPWIFLYPQGMKKIVMYMRDRFNNTPVVITENGVSENDNLNPSITDTLNDIHRVNYLHSYLNSLANAIREGADVRGYFVWSLLDNFEWLNGYKLRFGLHYVNYTNLQRTPKLSATRGDLTPGQGKTTLSADHCFRNYESRIRYGVTSNDRNVSVNSSSTSCYSTTTQGRSVSEPFP